MKGLKNGNISEGVLFLMALIVIVTVAALTQGVENKTAPGLPPVGQQAYPANPAPAGTKSAYSQSTSISTGNAPYSFQSSEEYIVIYNNGAEPIDITGWRLANAKSSRPYDTSGTLRYFPSDIAYIPQATLFIPSAGRGMMQNVVLKQGESAIVVTGSLGSHSPYEITSFKENICSGYLDNMPEYSFTPDLSRNCPRPADEPGLDALPTECRDFIKRLPSCQVPKFDTRDREGNTCSNCINGEPLPSSCVAFAKERFSYAGCLAYHESDPDFSSRTWRIFLGRGWEMWAKNYETISLFDRAGRLVDSNSY
ncbi:MAG: lamin tail domain-containing protein [bacterium]|nr:lamin tail domain-containing protein [bacterium]